MASYSFAKLVLTGSLHQTQQLLYLTKNVGG